jgi:hypothetical protein
LKNQLETWSFRPRVFIGPFLYLPIKSTPLWLRSPIGCLTKTLFCPFVIYASSFFPNCLQIYRTDGGSKFLRQRRVCIPNIPFLLRARSTEINTKIVDTFQWNTFYLRCALCIVLLYVNYMNMVINFSRNKFSETQTVGN